MVRKFLISVWLPRLGNQMAEWVGFAYIPQAAAAWLQSVVTSKWQFLILVNIFLLALGCAMEIISAILIVAPLLAPIAASYGIDPVHFGIIFIVNLELGYLTPPMGLNLIVAMTAFREDFWFICKAVLPFMIKAKSGHIVNTNSVAGKMGSPCSSGYAASKHALQVQGGVPLCYGSLLLTRCRASWTRCAWRFTTATS
jgi:NAD(P)-dependent dehydrogenase (short-subunit alcohol dehydrogenase family)